MRRLLVTCALLGGLAGGGCAGMDIANPFAGGAPAVTNNGVEAARSELLDVALPQGMRRFPSHGYRAPSASGGEGLEVLRGPQDAAFLMRSLHAALNAQGWQLRSCWRRHDILSVYENQTHVAVIRISSQAMLSLLEIWTGTRLPDGSPLNIPLPPSPGRESPSTAAPDTGGFAPEGTTQDWENPPRPAAPASGIRDSGGLEERTL